MSVFSFFGLVTCDEASEPLVGGDVVWFGGDFGELSHGVGGSLLS